MILLMLFSVRAFPSSHSLFAFVAITSLFIISLHESILPDLENTNPYQKVYRELIKAENTRMIEQFNNDQAHGFKLSSNQFLSLRNDEFLSIYTTNAKFNDTIHEVSLAASKAKGSSLSGTKGDSLPSNIKFQPSTCQSINIDWSMHATSVKQQGQCQSCYAHSSLATIESMMHLEYGIKYDLSEQHITECTVNWAPKGYEFANNLGCEGGWGWKTMVYIQFYGVALEKNYPYTLGTDPKLKPCVENSIKGERFKITGYKKFVNYVWPESQCNILDEVLQQGKTLAVSIFVPQGIQFQFYGSKTPDIDIWNICGNYQKVNHEMQLVGSNDRYWKLKNSFGVGWGEKGYFYLDKSRGLNCLNVCMDFAYPIGVPPLEG